MGDLRAQITAVTTGERRFLELVKRYGKNAVLGSVAILMDQSEAKARANTRAIPDGVYEAESFMDDDGVEIGQRVPIRVRVEKRGDEMTIDLSDVSRQVRGFYNSGVTTGIACAQVAFKCLTTPTEYPVNDGSFRNLKVIMPMGRVISAERPFPMRVWMTYPMTVIDTIFKALASAIPDRVAAGHHADLVFPNIHGVSSATVCINDGDTHNSPSEQLEAKYPVLVERYSLREDSAGAGRKRGGLGAEMVVQALSPFALTTRIDRVHCKPWGLDGGGDAAGNGIGIRRNGQWEAELQNAKIFGVRLNRGDAYMMQSGGGGGFGDPKTREPEMVARDVREGYVSRAAARRLYGVSVTSDGIVDPRSTAELRREGERSSDGDDAFEIIAG